MDVKIVLSL